MDAESMKLSMERTWINNKWFKIIPTNYIIWCWWDVVRVNNRDVIAGAIGKDKYNSIEQVKEGNLYWLHIELVWDFNLHDPSDEQYRSLKILIDSINKRAWKKLEIKYHSDFASKVCPWKNFDITWIL